LVAAVEEAVSIDDLVRLMTLHHGRGTIVEITLGEDAPLVGKAVGEVAVPAGAALLTILRGGAVIVPMAESSLAAGDELVFVTSADVEQQIRDAFRRSR
jgi:trk system potassium uptake protein TrkA